MNSAHNYLAHLMLPVTYLIFTIQTEKIDFIDDRDTSGESCVDAHVLNHVFKMESKSKSVTPFKQSNRAKFVS